MINPKLQKVFEALDTWCQRRNVPYDLTIDEDDLQGVLIFRRHNHLVPRLMQFLRPLLMRENIFNREIGNRSGTILAFSLKAISENVVEAIGGSLEPAYMSKLEETLSEKIHWARLQQDRQGHKPKGQASLGGRQKSRGGDYHATKVGMEPIVTRNSMAQLRERRSLTDRLNHNLSLAENLQGLAANFQPGEVKQRFEQALRSLGLLDRLKASGIVNKDSEDGQRIVFYIKDSNQALRPVSTFEYTNLGEANNLEKAIEMLSDLARNQAPGTSEQQRERQKEQEQAVREIAKRYAMPNPEDAEAQAGSLLQPSQQPQAQEPVQEPAQAPQQARPQAAPQQARPQAGGYRDKVAAV